VSVLTIEQAFGHVIRKLRKELMISQEKLAFASMLDRTFISALECGRKQPTLVTIFQLAGAFNVPVSKILYEVELLLRCNNVSLRESIYSSIRQYPAWSGEMSNKTLESSRQYFGAETILIVDDEQMILSMFDEFLSEFGYTVFKAVDGMHALEIFRERCDDIKLVVMDVIMPRLDGVKAYKEMAKIRPDVNVLFMSAYSANCFEGFNAGSNFVRKPISPYDLVGKVRECIDLKNN